MPLKHPFALPVLPLRAAAAQAGFNRLPDHPAITSSYGHLLQALLQTFRPEFRSRS